MRRAERRSQAGFTLIEVIVVLVIMGLIGTLVLMRGPLRSTTVDMRQESGTVAGALRLARSRAIATNRPVPVRFGARGVQIGDDAIRPLLPGMVVAVAGGAAPGPVILFQPDGSSSGGTVQLTQSGRTARVGVNWLTGRVAVADRP